MDLTHVLLTLAGLVAAGLIFWNRSLGQPDWESLPTLPEYLALHPECATTDAENARCHGCGFRQVLFNPSPAGVTTVFATPAWLVARCCFAAAPFFSQSPLSRFPTKESSHGMGLTTLKRKWLKKHLQELRASKDEDEEKGECWDSSAFCVRQSR